MWCQVSPKAITTEVKEKLGLESKNPTRIDSFQIFRNILSKILQTKESLFTKERHCSNNQYKTYIFLLEQENILQFITLVFPLKMINPFGFKTKALVLPNTSY